MKRLSIAIVASLMVLVMALGTGLVAYAQEEEVPGKGFIGTGSRAESSSTGGTSVPDSTSGGGGGASSSTSRPEGGSSSSAAASGGGASSGGGGGDTSYEGGASSRTGGTASSSRTGGNGGGGNGGGGNAPTVSTAASRPVASAAGSTGSAGTGSGAGNASRAAPASQAGAVSGGASAQDSSIPVLVADLEEDGAEGDIVRLFGNDIPLGGLDVSDGWGLFNLLMALLCIAAALLFAVRDIVRRKGTVLRFAAAVLGLLPLLLFFLLDNIGGVMYMFTRWSILFGILFGVHLVLLVVAHTIRRREDDDDGQDDPAQT